MNPKSIMPNKRQNSLQKSSYVVIHLCDLLEQANILWEWNRILKVADFKGRGWEEA